MSNELQVFHYMEEHEIRTTVIDGIPYFVGKDVATALGYKNPQEAIREHVDLEDKGVSEILTPTKNISRFISFIPLRRALIL